MTVFVLVRNEDEVDQEFFVAGDRYRLAGSWSRDKRRARLYKEKRGACIAWVALKKYWPAFEINVLPIDVEEVA